MPADRLCPQGNNDHIGDGVDECTKHLAHDRLVVNHHDFDRLSFIRARMLTPAGASHLPNLRDTVACAVNRTLKKSSIRMHELKSRPLMVGKGGCPRPLSALKSRGSFLPQPLIGTFDQDFRTLVCATINLRLPPIRTGAFLHAHQTKVFSSPFIAPEY